jgi:hypothetical protein
MTKIKKSEKNFLPSINAPIIGNVPLETLDQTPERTGKDTLSVIKIPVTGDVPLEVLDVVLKLASIEAVYHQADIDLVTNTKDKLIEQLEDELLLAHLDLGLPL